MNRVVLIHCGSDDAHAEAVADRLREMRIAVCLLPRDRCFLDWDIRCDDGEVVVHAGGSSWVQGDIRSVHWRWDFIAEPAWVRWDGITPDVSRFIAEQRSIHVESTFKRLAADTPFVNDIGRNRVCDSKALQHRVAGERGLRVPETYIGSDPDRAGRFARRLWDGNRRCCTKNIESTHAEIGGVKHARLTRLFLPENMGELSGLPACPMFFQEHVEKRFEYRVTVVGQEVYACRIDSQAAGGNTAIDWRHYDLPVTPHHSAILDPQLRQRLIGLVSDLGLTFGAVDLVENPDGEFFFLEINSMGQWLWIEDLTELPITAAVARHLADLSLIGSGAGTRLPHPAELRYDVGGGAPC